MYSVFIILVILIFFVFGICVRSLFDRPHKESILAVREAYSRVVTRHLLSIAEVHIFGSRLIAIDRNLRKLVMIVHRNGITSEKCIDVSKILFCHVLKDEQKLSLQVILVDNPGIINFPFFDHEIDDKRDLSSRLKKAQFWKRKIQTQLSTFQVDTIFL